jgi:GNAT superfamily N-acetyltransferase
VTGEKRDASTANDRDLRDDCSLRLGVWLGPNYGEPTEYILHYTGTILGGEDFDIPIGKVEFYVIDLLKAVYDGESAWWLLDCLDSSLAHFCELVHANRNRYKPSLEALAGEDLGRLLALGSIELDHSYRGKGLGLRAMDMICKRMGAGCSLTVLKAFPTQWEGRVAEDPKAFQKDRAKLVAYYRRAGFVPVIGNGLMAKSL